jgi:putative SOS response-associated peptidase YedK
MCGRLNVSSGPLTLLFMDMVSQPYPEADRYNVAPTDQVAVLRHGDGALEVASMRWWLTPFWSKEVSTRYSMFNAKAETVATSRAFKEPFARRRCLVPVCGFYEWARQGGQKLPYYIRPQADDGLLLAGLWDRWRGPDRTVESFTIVTAAAHPDLSFVHQRQPVMLSRAEAHQWVDPRAEPGALQASLLVPRLPVPLCVVPVSERLRRFISITYMRPWTVFARLSSRELMLSDDPPAASTFTSN